jgi:hypothetical protein
MYKPTIKRIRKNTTTTLITLYKANKLYKDDYILNNDANKTVYKHASELGIELSNHMHASTYSLLRIYWNSGDQTYFFNISEVQYKRNQQHLFFFDE